MRLERVVFLYYFFVVVLSNAEAQVATEGERQEVISVASDKMYPPFRLVSYGAFLYVPVPDSLKISRWKESADPLKDRERSFRPMEPGECFWRSTRQAAVGYGLFLSLLFACPPRFTKWDHYFGKELLQNAGRRFHSAWTNPPVWDHDLFITNYIGHPYGGSFYYNSMRTKGGTAAASFRFAVFASTLWEYVPEAFFEQPSIQDLIVTPILGSLAGEAVHRLTLQLSKGGFRFLEKVAVLLLNPSYVVNHGFKTPSDKTRAQLRKMGK